VDELRCRLGGVALHLRGADPRLGQLCVAAASPAAEITAYGSADDEPEGRGGTGAELVLDVCLEEAPSRMIFGPHLEVARQDGRLCFSFTRYDLELSWSETQAQGRGRATMQPTLLAARALLQLALSVLLLRRGGLAVHAASLVRHGRAFLFPAASGVGKSTLVRCSGGAPALSDEISLIGTAWAGGPSPFLAFPSPFWSDGARPPDLLPPAAAQGYPLERICFIAQGAVLRRHPLGCRDAVDLLLRHLLMYGPSPELAGAALDTTVRLCRTVPAERLELPPEPSIWPELLP